MTSKIDATKPASPVSYTVDMRNNFAAAKAEIEALQNGDQFLNTSTINPVAPGSLLSVQYGNQTAFDIYSKVLNTNPAEANRNTFNVIEGILTLPPTVTTSGTYHTAISGFASNQSSNGKGVGFGVGGYAVAEANGVVVGGFGSVNVDSPRDPVGHKPNGMYTGVRMQLEHDWYTGNATSSVRGTLHDGFFSVPPNTLSNLFGYATNIFTPQYAMATGYFTTNSPTDTQSVMTIMSITSSGASIGVVATPIVGGLHLEGTGVDSSANITIVPFIPTPPINPFTGLPCTGTGNLGTYLVSANVGTVGSAVNPVTIRATNSYQWNASYVSPDGVAVTALDVGQRNFAVSNSFGDRSQYVNWRYTNVVPDAVSGQANERMLQQWVEPIVGVTSPQAAPPDTGGVLYVQNYLQALAPASYGVQNWNWNNAAFVSKNNANTGWIDALHVEGNDRVVLGAGSNGITEIATSQGIHVEIIDSGVPPVNSIGMKASTATSAARIYMVGGGNLQLSNVAMSNTATLGFVSPFPVITGAPVNPPAKADSTNALGAWDNVNKAIDIFDSASSSWYVLNASKAGTGAGGIWNAGTVIATGPNLQNTAGTLDVSNNISLSGSVLVNTGTPVASEILSVNGGFNMGGTIGAGGTVNVTMGTNMSVVNGGLLPGQFPPTAGSTALWVVGSGLTRIMIEGVGNAGALTMRTALGTVAAPLPPTNNVSLGSVLGMGYDGSIYTGAMAGWYMNTLGVWSATNHGTVHLWFATKSNAVAQNEQMRLTNGHLLIGTTTDDTINFLQVNGPSESTFFAEGVSNNLTLTGTNQAGALVLTKGFNLFSTVPASSGALLPQIGSIVTAGTWVDIFNNTTTAARIYGTGTQTIDSVAAATGVPLSANARCRYFANTGSTWVSALMGGISV